ncbi:MAG TPA: acetyl-CoA carboxylase biotin carboxyl carrier protein [Patescibacteria group bacterium]|nr:acetyl-CoA carboxylase biotin carboxyl carrier protein [Patescibacteria group bacterium]
MAGKKKPKGPAPSVLDWSEVEHVLKLMAEHGLEEFEYSDGPLHVKVKKASANRAATPGEAAEAAASPSAEAAGEDLHVVKSPIVGTFYAAPNPDAPAFVRVGDRVSAGQALCIIEAMKLMNEIESDVAGEIARIFVENGQPVEYGEPLFAIRPAGPVRAA